MVENLNSVPVLEMDQCLYNYLSSFVIPDSRAHTEQPYTGIGPTVLFYLSKGPVEGRVVRCFFV